MGGGRGGEGEEGRETVFTCLYPYTVQTRPLAGTASGMASDSVRGRGEGETAR